MPITSKENSFSAWAFVAGMVLAILMGISTTILPVSTLIIYSKSIYGVLILIGLVIGFVTTPEGKDANTFLWAGAVLVIISKFGMESVSGSLIGIGIGDAVSSVFGALLALFVPATMVVAMKVLFSATKV